MAQFSFLGELYLYSYSQALTLEVSAIIANNEMFKKRSGIR